jgi:hypothetical protein
VESFNHVLLSTTKYNKNILKGLVSPCLLEFSSFEQNHSDTIFRMPSGWQYLILFE